jgi:endonuclease/exonuclease/phosphatase (EEP) superfamily protein YafD
VERGPRNQRELTAKLTALSSGASDHFPIVAQFAVR